MKDISGISHPKKCPKCGMEVLHLLVDDSIQCSNSFCRYVMEKHTWRKLVKNERQ